MEASAERGLLLRASGAAVQAKACNYKRWLGTFVQQGVFMEFLYEVGPCKHFKDGDNFFTIYSRTISNPQLIIIGDYIDKKGIVQRVRRDSVWGKKVLALCVEAPKIELSESQKRLAELIASIGKPVGG